MKNIFIKGAVLSLMVFLIANVYSLEAGVTAGDFTLETIEGEEIVLNDILKNKKAVLVFWTTWCPSCRKEIPFVEKFYKENKENTSVIGINVGESKVKVEGFVEKQKISYPVVLDLNRDVSKMYNLVGVPTIVAINKDGEVEYYGHSMEEMEKKVDF